MLVPNEFRKCVAYLTVDVVDEDTGLTVRTPAGTAFLVSVPVEDIAFVVYAVTARHVIDASRPYGQLFMRLNMPSAGFMDAEAPPQDEWTMHPSTAVAAVPVAVPGLQAFDVKVLPVDMLVTDESVTKQNIGEGDEVSFIGLFTAHPGASRSEPVVRFGHIACMPYEPVPIKMDPAPNAARVPVRAYLDEVAAWGGQSGSPALLYFAPDRVPGTITLGGLTGGGFGLLGLVHGHYFHRQTLSIRSGETIGEGDLDFNLGISVVIPAQDILSVLNSEEFMEQRRKAAEEFRKSAGGEPSPSSDPPPNAPSADSPLGGTSEFQRFEDLTSKLVRVPKKELDEKRKDEG